MKMFPKFVINSFVNKLKKKNLNLYHYKHHAAGKKSKAFSLFSQIYNFYIKCILKT